MSEVVVDASAVLALLNTEPGYAMVAAIVDRAAVSAVNLAEVVSRLSDQAMPAMTIRGVVGNLGCAIVPFDSELAYAAGSLRPATRAYGLSLGDRACLALAQRLDVPALTADEAWRSLDVAAEIRLIR